MHNIKQGINSWNINCKDKYKSIFNLMSLVLVECKLKILIYFKLSVLNEWMFKK